MSRIHVDILKSWNFNDKEEVHWISVNECTVFILSYLFKILSGDEFRAEMIKLIEPLLSERQPGR
jgi:hypothetical protein